MNKKNISIIKWILILLIIGIIFYLINKLNIFKGTTPKEIKEYLNSFGIFAPIIFIIMFTIVPLTLFPDSILAISGGLAFGLVEGSIYTLIGAISGATLSFFITRMFGKSFIEKFTKKKFNSLGNKLEKHGFFIILILRLVPLFPFDIISYSAGLSEIKYKHFISATFIGTIPGILVYTNLGDKIVNIGSKEFYISIVLLALLLIISIVLKKIFSNKKIGNLDI